MSAFIVFISIHNRHNFLNVQHFLKKRGFHILTTFAEFSHTVRNEPIHALIFDAEAFFTDGNDILHICEQENKLPGFPMIFISDKYELDDSFPEEQIQTKLYHPFKLNELERILSNNLGTDIQDSPDKGV